MTDRKKLREAAMKATPVEPQDLMRYEHGGGRLAILRDGKRQLIADFYGDGEDTEFYGLCTPQTILSLLDDLDRPVGEVVAWVIEQLSSHGEVLSESRHLSYGDPAPHYRTETWSNGSPMWKLTPLYAAPSPAIGRETVTDEMVAAAHAAYHQTVGGIRDGNPMRNALEAALGAQP